MGMKCDMGCGGAAATYHSGRCNWRTSVSSEYVLMERGHEKDRRDRWREFPNVIKAYEASDQFCHPTSWPNTLDRSWHKYEEYTIKKDRGRINFKHQLDDEIVACADSFFAMFYPTAITEDAMKLVKKYD